MKSLPAVIEWSEEGEPQIAIYLTPCQGIKVLYFAAWKVAGKGWYSNINGEQLDHTYFKCLPGWGRPQTENKGTVPAADPGPAKPNNQAAREARGAGCNDAHAAGRDGRENSLPGAPARQDTAVGEGAYPMNSIQKGAACVTSGLLIFSGMLAMEYGWRLGLIALWALVAGALIFMGIGYFSTSYWGGLDD